MSILIVEVLPHGIILAADRYVTASRWQPDTTATFVYQWQDTGTKVLRWPHKRALIGAVGLFSIGVRSLHDWLYDFIGDHPSFTDSASVANDLRDRLQEELGNLTPPESLIIEFATFAARDGHIVPEMWHITNVHGISPETGEYDSPTDYFNASEQILSRHLKNVPAAELRTRLAQCAANHDPYWFHQGFGLGVFNTVEKAIKQAYLILHQAGKLNPPQSLQDWERHARMLVLMYGAHFEAFGEPGQRYVGGGADVLSIPWPDAL